MQFRGQMSVGCLTHNVRWHKIWSTPTAKALGKRVFTLPGGSSWKCCDALRCSGPHARYTDWFSKLYPLLRKAWVIFERQS